MRTLTIVGYLFAAATVAFGVWAAFALLASMAQYVPSLP
jgi:hypothetical protein